jgi:hypothetical protein
MTQPIFDTVKEVTGIVLGCGCPWRAMYDPLVARTLTGSRAFDKGNLEVAFPDISYRLYESIEFYDTARAQHDNHYNRLELEQMRQEHERKKQGG